ncbi:MAG: SDR family NAD(P)-dependent oxidoreductase [Alphaproteobacteria bacterium]|nr:SDR family NAD(P)-dependent oxidoreductase [Alphaproteobacteria bacterium]
MTRYSNETVWVIGASSGIGLALAQRLANEGARLIVSARNAASLGQFVAQHGTQHIAAPLDIHDPTALQKTAEQLWQQCGTIHRVIFMAALYQPMKLTELDMQQTRDIIEVNLTSVFELVHVLLPKLIAQPRAQLALCGSVAGYTGLPSGQPYSATKAAIINLAESLHAEAPNHLDIKLINPGFVRTPLTDKNNFAMPMIITPERAAQYIADGLRTKRFEIHFPKGFTRLLKLLRILPYGIRLWIAKKTEGNQ